MAQSATLVDRRVYTMGDVDRYLGLHPGTGRRWIDGYERAGRVYEPVVRRQRTGDDWVCWGEFIEASLLSAYRDAGVSLQRLRPAVQRLRDVFETSYPLAAAAPFLEVQGRELVMQVQSEVDLPCPLAMVVVRSGQLQLADRMQDFVDRVDYDRGSQYARRLHVVRGGSVSIDPQRAGGRPSVRAVPTEILAEGYRAGESVAGLADLYELPSDDVEQALRYELVRATALSA